MGNVILLGVCLVLGIVLGWLKRLPEGGHTTLNGFILNVSLPALTLLEIHNIHFRANLLYSVAMPWLLFGIGYGFFWVVGRMLGFSMARTGGLMLVGGLANTSFVGIPMIAAFYGRSGMATGILIDQLGTYLVLSTLGITIAAVYSSGSTEVSAVLKKIFTFTPFLALLLAFAMMHVRYPGWFEGVLHPLAATLAPLALVSVGMQLRLNLLHRNVVSPLATGLVFKLLLGPAIVAVLYVWFLHAHGRTIQITLFESAMGPQIGGAIVAIQHGLDPPLITLLVTIGIVLSFLTLPAWWYFLQAV